MVVIIIVTVVINSNNSNNDDYDVLYRVSDDKYAIHSCRVCRLDQIE